MCAAVVVALAVPVFQAGLFFAVFLLYFFPLASTIEFGLVAKNKKRGNCIVTLCHIPFSTGMRVRLAYVCVCVCVLQGGFLLAFLCVCAWDWLFCVRRRRLQFSGSGLLKSSAQLGFFASTRPLFLALGPPLFHFRGLSLAFALLANSVGKHTGVH